MRTQVLEPIHPETKPCDEIFAGLAEACGVGEYFPFTVEELAAAQLETVGVRPVSYTHLACRHHGADERGERLSAQVLA